jgi:Ni,Fe-hydrogenase III small subunit
MFVLLHHLHRVRRELAVGKPQRRGSLAFRHVDAGSCNGCEHELTATANPLYDLQRFGLNVVASPRHADALVVSGAVTTRMADALLSAYHAMPGPRLVVALGNCARGCGLLGDPAEIVGPVEAILPVDFEIPGCPPTPQQIADALIEALDRTALSRPGQSDRATDGATDGATSPTDRRRSPTISTQQKPL